MFSNILCFEMKVLFQKVLFNFCTHRRILALLGTQKMQTNARFIMEPLGAASNIVLVISMM
jgi:hypothetical protein